MRNMILLAGCGMFLVLQFGCSARREAGVAGKPLVDNERLRNGQIQYMKYCQPCHPAGEAGLGPSITWVPSFLKRFQVRHGLGTMPSFKKRELSKKDLDDIIVYLKAVKKA